MALSTKPWGSISESDYSSPENFCNACLINANSGPASGWTKDKCKLPVHEPGGALNRNGLLAAQGALVGARGGVDAPAATKQAAARKLMRLMSANDMQPAMSLKQMAGMMNG